MEITKKFQLFSSLNFRRQLYKNGLGCWGRNNKIYNNECMAYFKEVGHYLKNQLEERKQKLGQTVKLLICSKGRLSRILTFVTISALARPFLPKILLLKKEKKLCWSVEPKITIIFIIFIWFGGQTNKIKIVSLFSTPECATLSL